MTSEERFGYEWDKYSEMDPNYESQFLNWIHPLAPEDFRQKRVLDAGCGMGRNSFWALRWGAKEVVAFDFDARSVEAARRTLKDFGNAHVEFRDIYDIPWESFFDLVFSNGVIHHLHEPRVAIRRLVRALKPGGTLVFWVYSREGAGWFLWVLDPLRKILTSRLPLPAVHAFAYVFSVPLWLFLKAFGGPTAYFRQLAGFSFRHVHSIVFDQLIPKVANYWTRKEVLGLADGMPLKGIQVLRPPNDMGWTFIAEKY